MFPKKLACAKKFAHGPRSEKPKIMTTIKGEDDAEWAFLAYIMPDAQWAAGSAAVGEALRLYSAAMRCERT